MKFICAFFVMSMSLAYASDLYVGKYGLIGESHQKQVVIAKVSLRNKKYEIKFTDGCKAELRLSHKTLRGECTIGRGYLEVYYEAEIKQKQGVPYLRWLMLELGDEENIYRTAIKL
jgi:hypothetical protein